MHSVCQDWVRIYGQGQNSVARDVIEDYDKGYNILGMTENYRYAWLLKTDINGDILWDKRFGNIQIQVGTGNIDKTNDGGYIFCGTWNKFNPSMDAFIIKMDACAEIEWCKTLITPTNYDMGIRVKPTTEGDFLLLGGYFLTDPVSNVSLFKFNNSGDLIWHQFYPLTSLYYNDQPKELIIDNDGYLILTNRYFSNPGGGGGAWLRSNFIKIDTAGTELWNTVYVDSGYYVSTPWASIKNQCGHYYASCTHTIVDTGDNPALIKVLHNGDQSYNHDIISTGNFNLSGMGTIDLLKDTNFVMFGTWNISGEENNVVIKTDTLGNLCDSSDLAETTNSFISATKTFDDKFISVANDALGAAWRVFAVKVNSDLEYDSIYSQPFTYDSLCPYPIISSTVDPDCENVFVGIEEPFKNPETTKLKVYPNPASDQLTISMPKYLVVNNTMSEIPSTTVYHQWGSAMLEVYDLFGRKMTEREVIRAEREVELDVSDWQTGMYIIRLVFQDQVVANEKISVVR